MIPPLFGKQEVGIWRVKKRFPRYGVPIWSLWQNIKFLPSIVAEKNATKNGHIQNVCSMCIEKCDEGKTVYPKSLSNLSTLYFSRMLVETQVPYFTDYRSMGTIGRIAAFRLNFLGNTKIGRRCRWQLG
jgi:hypothetical protein